MNNIQIRRPHPADVAELSEFFRIVITDTFIKEGIGHLVEAIEEEIEIKNHYLKMDIMNDGDERCFLLAIHHDKVIGSIEYGPASKLINECTNDELKDLNEVGTVFVHPDYQRQGIGNLLLKEMYLILKSNNIEEICLDSGYRQAQKIWEKKFGEPQYVLKDYWGKGLDHMIWNIKVHKLIK